MMQRPTSLEYLAPFISRSLALRKVVLRVGIIPSRRREWWLSNVHFGVRLIAFRPPTYLDALSIR